MRVQAVLLAGCLSLVGCGGADNEIEQDLQIDRSQSGFVAQFAPGDSVIPFPSNLLFSGSVDGTLNIPVVDSNDASDPAVAMNALDGFSTIAPISTTFNKAIDASTLTGSNVRLYEVTLTGIGGGVTGVTRALTYGQEYVASLSPLDTTGQTLVITPLIPLKAHTHYLVAMTNGIQSADGLSASAEATYVITKSPSALVDGSGVSQVPTLTDEEALALEPLRQLTNAQEAALAGQGLSRDITVLSWTFSTQSVGDVLATVRTNAAGTSAINPSAIGTAQQLTGVSLDPGNASIYAGSLTLPYYLTNGTVATDPLNKSWAGAAGSYLTWLNTTPVETSSETVPLLVSVPNHTAMPSNGWPVVIFQHGITSDRTAMLAIAETLASIGFAAVAIDMPLHGLATTSPLYSGIERTFDLDLADNTTSASGPDGTADSSGTHFINLKNLVVTRDNVRQSVADLFALHTALAAMDYDGGGADFDTDNVFFIGHSLGAMVGVPFLALEPNVKDAVLGMPGGGIAKLLDGSASFGPVIAAGLGAVGVTKGTADYESFMGAAQTLVDSGDPNNYTAAAVANRGVLMFEVTGDAVIPNNVYADAPAGTVPSVLAGTDPLRTLMGLTQVSNTSTLTAGDDVYVRFSAGDHSSLLDPTSSATATSAMQTAAASFMATGGVTLPVSEPSVVE